MNIFFSSYRFQVGSGVGAGSGIFFFSWAGSGSVEKNVGSSSLTLSHTFSSRWLLIMCHDNRTKFLGWTGYPVTGLIRFRSAQFPSDFSGYLVNGWILSWRSWSFFQKSMNLKLFGCLKVAVNLGIMLFLAYLEFEIILSSFCTWRWNGLLTVNKIFFSSNFF